MAQQQLDRPQVLGSAVQQGCLGAPHRVRTVAGGVEADRCDPGREHPRVLPGRQMLGSVDTAGEEIVRPNQTSVLDPVSSGFPRLARNLESDRAACFLLQDRGPITDGFAV